MSLPSGSRPYQVGTYYISTVPLPQGPEREKKPDIQFRSRCSHQGVPPGWLGSLYRKLMGGYVLGRDEWVGGWLMDPPLPSCQSIERGSVIIIIIACWEKGLLNAEVVQAKAFRRASAAHTH